MKAEREHSEAAQREAARWILKSDRGLSAEEQDALSQWLAASAEHRAAWAEAGRGWEELDRLLGLQTTRGATPDPDLLAPERRRPAGHSRKRIAVYALVSALGTLAAGVAFVLQGPADEPREPSAGFARSLAPIERRDLSDGSRVELNRGAIATTHYSEKERRVQLVLGEAHFKVAKDSARPFVVEVAGVAVRAVGTEFDVRLDGESVDVLVTEGTVSVGAAPDGGADPVALEGLPPITVGERSVIPLTPGAGAPRVEKVSQSEIESRLAWQPKLLDFTDAPLSQILAEFNRRNPVRLTIRDPELGELRLSTTFRSDNLEGFLRLMTSDFGMRAEWQGEREVALSRR